VVAVGCGGGFGRLSISSKIHDSYCVELHKARSDGVPHMVGLREAMEEEQRWLVGGRVYVFETVDCDVFGGGDIEGREVREEGF